MRKLYPLILLLLWATPAEAATNVWLFYGAGPPIFSNGINKIARKARAISGVGHVSVHRYFETQAVYNAAVHSSPHDNIVLVGYSCGGNASLSVAQGLAQSNRAVNILAMQPSIWCGWYLPTTRNVVYAQDTYAGCLQTLGFGCMRFYGNAQHTLNIFRPANHLRADNDPDYQRDVLSAINCIANPGRPGCQSQRAIGPQSEITLYPGQRVRP